MDFDYAPSDYETEDDEDKCNLDDDLDDQNEQEDDKDDRETRDKDGEESKDEEESQHEDVDEESSIDGANRFLAIEKRDMKNHFLERGDELAAFF